jgi:hypothetical protein
MTACRLNSLLFVIRSFQLGWITIFLSMNVAAADLDDFQWRNRLLILVAPEAAGTSVGQVRQHLERRTDEIAERDLLVIQLFVQGQSLIDGRPIAASNADLLREQLRVEPDSRQLLLVGKDGDIKRRAHLLTDLQEIFSQVDAMSMRRAEMREREQSGESRLAP